MSAAVLLAKIPSRLTKDIDEAMSWQHLRCGTYPRIRRAIIRAANSAPPKALRPASNEPETTMASGFELAAPNPSQPFRGQRIVWRRGYAMSAPARSIRRSFLKTALP